MNAITIFPENEKQDSLLRNLLEELKIRFEVEKIEDETLLSEKEFVEKINHSIEQFKKGEARTISPQQQKEMFGV